MTRDDLSKVHDPHFLEELTKTATKVDETLSKLPPEVVKAYEPSRRILADMIARELAKQVNALVKQWP